jgi:hypothetical protein
MTNLCPNCGHENFEGALFCSECGAKLINQGGLSTSTINASDLGLPVDDASPHPQAPVPTVDAIVSLHVVRTGQILPLVGRNEFTIGRVSEGQSILPDIDLTPYEAYNQGVSRLHATIKLEKGAITITDLGSSNGTWLGGTRLEPHSPQPLKHGDVVFLGKLKVQVLIYE